MLNQIPLSIAITGRVTANVRINQAPAVPHKGGPGRPRKRGRRRPMPNEMLEVKRLPRLKLKLYNSEPRHVRLAEQTGRFYKVPHRDVQVVAVEHLRGAEGAFRKLAF